LIKDTKAYLVLSAITLAFVFSSCITLERTVRLNIDGSGEEEMKMIYQKEFYNMLGTFTMMFDSAGSQTDMMDSMYNATSEMTKLRSSFDSTKGLKLIESYSEIQPDSSNLVYVKYTFDSVYKIGESLNKVSDDFEDQPAKITYGIEDGKMVFRYLYESPEGEAGEMEDSVKSEMMSGLASMFQNGKFRFELNLPNEVISSNATDSENRKLVWDLPLTGIITENKLLIEAVMKPE
jgi:antitoxin component YwqK of YwqJK toxin-antitoxin module